MKYRITRTSDYLGSETPPCRGAYKGKRTEWGEQTWYIDIDALEQLQDLIEETNKSVIVSREDIEIYDTYRE